MKHTNPELKFKMLPKKLTRISSEDLLYSEYACLSEFSVVLYPETTYSVSIFNETPITFECFANKICSQFKEDYPQFRELKSLKVLKYLKKEQDNSTYTLIQVNDFSEIPSPLYVVLSSNEVWVSISLEIQLGSHNYIFTATGEALLNRLLNKEDTNLCLVKTTISMWNHSLREKIDFLNLHYLIARYNVVYDSNGLWFEEEHINHFWFKVAVHLKMISVEELIFLSFQSKYKNKIDENVLSHVLWNKFASIPSFHSFANEVIFEKEYKLIKTITHSQIFKLNKANRLYVHYSTWGYKGESLNYSFYSDIESMPELNVIVRPKLRRLHAKDKSNAKGVQTKSKACSFKIDQPITFDLGHIYIPGSGIKKYKEKSNDESLLMKTKKTFKNNRKDSGDGNLSQSKSPFEKIHLHSNLLFRTFEGDNSDNAFIRIKENDQPNQSDHSDIDGSAKKSKPSIAKDIKKTVNKAFILNLLITASSVKMAKFSFDKFPNCRVRNFKQNINLKSYWNYYKSKCMISSLCISFVAVFLILISFFLLFYYFKL